MNKFQDSKEFLNTIEYLNNKNFLLLLAFIKTDNYNVLKQAGIAQW